MLHSDTNNESSEPDQPVPQPASPVESVPYQSVHQRVPPTDRRQPDQEAPQPMLPPDYRPPARALHTGAIIALTAVLALVLGTGLFAGWQFGHDNSTLVANSSVTGQFPPGTHAQPTLPALSEDKSEAIREAVIAHVRPAVVQINVTTPQGTALGSGVIIDKRGSIVTNNHVVARAQHILIVMVDGTELTAQLTGTDPVDDLAMVKIHPPANMPVAKLGNSSELKVGEDVLAIGNPLGITQTVTNGIISALNRTVSEGLGRASLPDAIQIDAPINPGNSGGALVDLQGNVIGIPTLTALDPEFNAPASGVAFAIPSNRITVIVRQGYTKMGQPQ